MEKQKKVLNVIKGYMSKFDIEELTIIEDDEDSVIFSGDVEKFLHPCETMQNEASGAAERRDDPLGAHRHQCCGQYPAFG